MKFLPSFDLTLRHFLFLCIILGGVVSFPLLRVRREESNSDEEVQNDIENYEHPDCEKCSEDQFYEVHSVSSMMPSGECYHGEGQDGSGLPSTLIVTGLGMTPGHWWHAQTKCQRLGGSLFEPIIGRHTLDGLAKIATEAHNSGCPRKRRKTYQEYWTGLHFQHEMFNENDQPEVVGASTGTSLDAFIEHEQFYLDYFFDGNPNRKRAKNHGSYESCVEMASSDHIDGIRIHGRLNDEDCFANNLPLCSFSYVAV